MSFEWWPPDGPWPSTTGGIRGPDSRNLTDLYNQQVLVTDALAALAVQVGSMATSIAQLAGDVRRLAGDGTTDPIGWPGLSSYLRSMLGAIPATDNDAIGRVVPHLTTQRIALYNLLVGSGFSPDEDGPIFYAAQSTIAGYTVLQQVRDAAQALSAVTGDLAALPVGSTIKDLIRSIDANALALAECCEEQLNPPPPTNSAPSPALCEDFNIVTQAPCVQVLSITEGQPGFNPGATVHTLDFGAPTDGYLTYDGYASGEANIPTYYVSWESTLFLCVEWDLTDNPAPPWSIEVVLVELVGGVYEQTYATVLDTVFATGPDHATFNRNSGIRLGLRLVYLDGEDSPPPAPNFWLSYGTAT